MTTVLLGRSVKAAFAALCLAALLTANGTAARADVLFSNLGPGSSFSQTTLTGGAAGMDQAIGFVASGTGTFTITSLEIPIAYSSVPSSTTTFLLATFHIGGPGPTLGVLGTFTGFPLADSANPLAVLDVSGAGVSLTGGTAYYLVEDATPTSVVLIHQNSIGQLGGVARSGDGAPWQTSGTFTSFAVRINGTATEAPEPGSLALLFTVGGVLGIARFRRRKQTIKAR